MGLFMVKTQIEAMGGSVKVKSKLGEGTEFLIRFAE
jgi:chemotaxis protein histidine kinase CheA